MTITKQINIKNSFLLKNKFNLRMFLYIFFSKRIILYNLQVNSKKQLPIFIVK